MKHYAIFPAILLSLLFLLLAGCARYPLGMSEEEWNNLTLEQQHDARKRQAEMDHERTTHWQQYQLQQEAMLLEEQRLQYEKDVADGMVQQFDGVCLGGSKCPGGRTLEQILSLKGYVDVDRIELTAHDNLGRKHGATIAIYADHHLIADNVDIKRYGSTQTFFVGVVARNIVIKVRQDDETVIESLKVFGQRLGPGQVRTYRPQYNNRQ